MSFFITEKSRQWKDEMKGGGRDDEERERRYTTGMQI